ncbi:MAG: tRNA pseudouridine(55) synthase TruB [Rhodothermaeota bacterium MED-G64]|nr:MAG: tRNA pseudouridine(55) synthase TruB [Rhodothermaeota bacterium MED-G64]
MIEGMNPSEHLSIYPQDAHRFSTLSLEEWQNGIVFPVNKPLQWTSFDVIRKLKPQLPVKKIGHAGTLDPLATGVLVCCVGRATKLISTFQEHLKVYRTTFTFGETTPSLDRATPVSQTTSWDPVSESELEAVIESQFIGTIQQVPPMYSAVKKDGKRLYNYARKGEEVERQPREAYIESCKILHYDGKQCTLEIACGKGTYIRTLVDDLAKAADSLGVVDELQRTKSGPYSIDEAWNIHELCDALKQVLIV